MEYIHRQIEDQLMQAASQFAATALTGPRQSGKSTLLKFLFQEYNYITFDDPVLRKQAREDPGLFMESIPSHSILDEIQYVPELLPLLKMRIDEHPEEKGKYLLSGLQVFHLMAGLTETLAGRVALFELLPFSLHELDLEEQTSLPQLFENLYKGFYPDPCAHGAAPRLFYSSYVQTYVERDIRQITSVHDLILFQRFIELLAARVAGIVNLSEVARDCGISHTTAQHWLSLLESSRIVYLLRPYFKNISKRVMKSPKLYFTDTGLLAYLLKYSESETLFAGPLSSNIFENFLITEVLKEKIHGGEIFEMYFYRDSNKNEIDLLIEKAASLHLVEIKMRKNIDRADARVVESFAPPDKELHRWLVSCYEQDLFIAPTTKNIPWWKIRSVV